MQDKGLEALANVATKSDNDIIVLVVVLSIVTVLLAVPFYKLIVKATASKRQQEISRESKLLDVIEGNSRVMAELKTLLSSTNANCQICKDEQIRRLDLVTNLQRNNHDYLIQIATHLKLPVILQEA